MSRGRIGRPRREQLDFSNYRKVPETYCLPAAWCRWAQGNSPLAGDLVVAEPAIVPVQRIVSSAASGEPGCWD